MSQYPVWSRVFTYWKFAVCIVLGIFLGWQARKAVLKITFRPDAPVKCAEELPGVLQ